MKLNRKIFAITCIIVVILVILLQLLYNRYSAWGFSFAELKPFILSGFVSIGLFAISIALYNSFVNPLSAFCIFIVGSGYSFIKFQNFEYSISSTSQTVLVVSTFCFILGVLISVFIKYRTAQLSITSSNRKKALYLVAIIGVITFILEIFKIGYIPITRILEMDVYGETNEQLIPILHYFVMLYAVIPSWAYIYYKKGLISKKMLKISFVFSLFILINFLSRQIILILLVSVMLTYFFYNKPSKKSIIIAGILPIIMFIGIGALRLSFADTDPLEYLRSYGGISYQTSTIETYLSIYSTRNFYTFDTFIRNIELYNYSSFGVYTFYPILTITLMNIIMGITIDPMFDSNKSLATYAIEPYLDFGMFGVIVINVIYGLVCGLVYKEYLSKKVSAIVPWSILLFCILMSVFTNYFNMFFIWFVILLNKIIISNNNAECQVK